MVNPIIQSLWIGGSLSKVEQLSVASFIKNGHEFHLYTYGDVLNIPEGTIVKNGNDIISEDLIFTYGNGSYAGFADWFRWELLKQKGGYWVDTDVICIKPFNFQEDLIFGFESENLVCPAVLGFPKEHELSFFLAENCKNPNRHLPYDSFKERVRKKRRVILGKGRHHIKWGEAGGPSGFSRALKHFDLMKLAKPFTYFFPLHHTCWNSVYDDTFANSEKLFEDTYAIHLWNEMSRRDSKFDKNKVFSSNSLIEKLKKMYLVD